MYLSIPVSGVLFSVGDGHALQGDGEVSTQAIECPMDLVDLTFTLKDDLNLSMPRANTPAVGLHLVFTKTSMKLVLLRWKECRPYGRAIRI